MKPNILEQLTRLDASSSTSILPPEKCLAVAQESIEIGVRPTAQKHNLHQHVVTRAKRDFQAAQIFCDDPGSQLKENREILIQVEKLRCIDQELRGMKRVVNKIETGNLLKTIPHVRELLFGYLRWKTIKPLLIQVDIPYSEDQSRSVHRFFKAKTVEASQDSLIPLARRYLFSQWLNGDLASRDSDISRAAVFVLTHSTEGQSKQTTNLVTSLRTFLCQIMNMEYQSMGDIDNLFPEDLVLFPVSYTGNIQDVVESYKRFSLANYCPEMFKKYALMITKGVPWRSRMEQLGFTYYSTNWLDSINIIGTRFLENILATPPSKNLDWTYLLTDSAEVLKTVKRNMLKG